MLFQTRGVLNDAAKIELVDQCRGRGLGLGSVSPASRRFASIPLTCAMRTTVSAAAGATLGTAATATPFRRTTSCTETLQVDVNFVVHMWPIRVSSGGHRRLQPERLHSPEHAAPTGPLSINNAQDVARYYDPTQKGVNAPAGFVQQQISAQGYVPVPRRAARAIRIGAVNYDDSIPAPHPAS